MVVRGVRMATKKTKEMKAVEFIKAGKRMCRSMKYCTECPINRDCCPIFQLEADDVIKVQKWAEENPEKKRKTYLEDLKEKYPNVSMNGCGKRPKICRAYLYHIPQHFCPVDKSTGVNDCVACWNEEMEVPNGNN